MSRGSIRLSNGSREAVVEFRTVDEPFAEPPNPYYIKVHAAFTQVMCFSGMKGRTYM